VAEPERRRAAARVAAFGLALYAGWEFRAFLADGFPLLFDAHSHLTRSWAVALALASGAYPTWSMLWYGGHALLSFYSPGFYALTGGIGFGIGDVAAATKAVLWTGQLAAVLGLYGFVFRLCGRPLLAVFAGVLMVGSSERAMVLGVIGNHPSVLIYAVLPFLLKEIVRCSSASWSPLRLLATQALLLAVMVIGHLANALILLPALLAFEAAWLWQERPYPAAWKPALAAIAGSLVALVGLTAFVTVPLISGLDRVSLSLTRTAPLHGAVNLESLWTVLGLAEQRLAIPFARDHGLIWCALGLVGGISSLRRSGRHWRPVFVGLCVNLGSIALLGERAAIGTAFFLFPLCAAGVDALAREVAARGVLRARFLMPAVGIACATLWPSSAGTPAPRYAPMAAMQQYSRLPATATRSRTFDVTRTTISLDGFYGESSFSPYFSARSIPFGGYPQGAPLATNLTMALASRLVEDLRGDAPALSEDSLDVLYLLHVAFLVDRDDKPALARLQLAPGSGARLEPGVVELKQVSPAIFSQRLVRLPFEGRLRDPPQLLGLLQQRWEDVESPKYSDPALAPLFRTGTARDWIPLLPWLQSMAIDRERATAEQFFAEPSLVVPPPQRSGGPAVFTVLRHLEKLDQAEIEARASAAGFVRLSYSYDPDVVVRVDGHPVAAWQDAVTGAVIAPFPSGTHTVSVCPSDTGPRVGLLAISAAIAGMLGVVLHRTRQRPPARALDRS